MATAGVNLTDGENGRIAYGGAICRIVSATVGG